MIEKLTAMIKGLEKPLYRDTAQMKSSHLWMKYEAEDNTRKKIAKQLKNILIEAGEWELDISEREEESNLAFVSVKEYLNGTR